MEPVSLVSQYQIEPYRSRPEKLRQIAVMFTGSPRTGTVAGRVLLLSDPTSAQAFFFEFRTQDIVYAEEAPSLSLPDGSTVSMVRLWVRKGTTALKIMPFHVQDSRPGLRDFFGG